MRARKPGATFDATLAADRATTHATGATTRRAPGQTPRSDLHAASRMPNPPRWLQELDLTQGKRGKW